MLDNVVSLIPTSGQTASLYFLLILHLSFILDTLCTLGGSQTTCTTDVVIILVSVYFSCECLLVAKPRLLMFSKSVSGRQLVCAGCCLATKISSTSVTQARMVCNIHLKTYMSGSGSSVYSFIPRLIFFFCVWGEPGCKVENAYVCTSSRPKPSVIYLCSVHECGLMSIYVEARFLEQEATCNIPEM